MHHINEWDAVPWNLPLPEKVGERFAGAGDTTENVRAELAKITQDPPAAVHFFKGEGLRWIRVGFGPGSVRVPGDVRRIGNAIKAGLQPADGKLYFQALRAHDLLFFLATGGDPGSKGMNPEFFGEPLDQVLKAWPASAGA